MQHDQDGSFTELAQQSMGGQPQQYGQAPSHGLYVQFYVHPLQNAEKTLEEGRPIFDETDYVRIMVPGDKTSIVERPARIGQGPNFDNFKYGQEYQMFKQGTQDALVGTPLSEWPSISRSQVRELEHFNVRTVEQLAGMPDTAVQNFSGVSGLRTRALRYMDEAKNGAALNQMQTELETRDNTIQTMANQIKDMQKALSELQNTTLVDKPTVDIKKSKREIKG